VKALACVLALQGALVGAQEAKPSPRPKGPRIAVEPVSFDFGPALPNKTLHKEFSVRNFGTEDLVIEGVSTTCGCTAALSESKLIKPGSAAALRVSLETRSYSGLLERSVLLRSNDPVRKLLEVKVRALVVAARAP
jgi:hypothetical protein